jgi:predicted small lipoprotein YifL
MGMKKSFGSLGSLGSLAVAALILSSLAACGSRTDLAPAHSDQPLPNAQLLTDIPVPTNATMDNERSLILADKDHWLGRVVMRFWQNTNELTSFYQAQMPGYGWEPIMSVTSASSVLSFARPDRAATIQIEESSLGLKSQVTITVAPRQAQGAGQGGYSGGGASSGGSSDYSRPAVRSESLPSPSR